MHINLPIASIAGDVIAKSLDEGNVDGSILYEYEKLWRERTNSLFIKEWSTRGYMVSDDGKNQYIEEKVDVVGLKKKELYKFEKGTCRWL